MALFTFTVPCIGGKCALLNADFIDISCFFSFLAVTMAIISAVLQQFIWVQFYFCFAAKAVFISSSGSVQLQKIHHTAISSWVSRHKPFILLSVPYAYQVCTWLTLLYCKSFCGWSSASEVPWTHLRGSVDGF